MSFLKDVDDILNEILTSYQNQLPDVDRSKGTLVFIKSACLASMLWGLYKYQDYIARQIFPDTADTAFLEKHAARRGLTRLPGETDASLLGRLLAVLRQPPAGGNKSDWELWALQGLYTHDAGLNTEWIENVKTAICYPNARGIGTVNIGITSDRSETGYEEIATADLISAVSTIVEANRPITAFDFQVIGATRKTSDVTMVVPGLSAGDQELIRSDIEAFMKSLPIGKTLYRAQLISIAIDRGADTVTLSTPASDVTVLTGPTTYERIWPGTITISAA